MEEKRFLPIFNGLYTCHEFILHAKHKKREETVALKCRCVYLFSCFLTIVFCFFVCSREWTTEAKKNWKEKWKIVLFLFRHLYVCEQTKLMLLLYVCEWIIFHFVLCVGVDWFPYSHRMCWKWHFSRFGTLFYLEFASIYQFKSPAVCMYAILYASQERLFM